MIYIFITILLLLLSLRYDICGRTKGKNLWYNAVLLILILIAGLRWRVGTDTLAYITRFYHLYPTIDGFSFSDYGFGNDPFYALINVFVKTLGGRFYMVQIIQASIVNILIFKYVRRHSNYIFTCILFYFFINYLNYTMEVMRGSISIVICLFGNDYILDKKWFKGYLLYSIAAMFHFQTIVIMLLPSLFWIRFNKFGIAILVIAFFVGLSLKNILEDYMFLLSENEILESEMEEKLNSKYGESHGNVLFFVGTVLIKVIYPILSLLLVKKYCEDDKLKRLEPFLILGVMFVLIQLNLPIAFRYVYYYGIYFALFYSEVFVAIIPKSLRPRSFFVFLRSILLFFPLLLYYGNSYYKTHKYHPYTSIIEMSVDRDKEKVFKVRATYPPPNKKEY